MLWKKESQRPDVLYINVLGDARDQCRLETSLKLLMVTLDRQPTPEKSDEIALQKRNEGNEKFRVGSYIKAMELYSDSLRFAKPDSEHISLAYANRASCFLCLKMYEQCLKDIDFAVEAGYPPHLMPKLDDRKANCLKEMQNDPQPYRKATIEPDDQFPCLAKVAQIQKNKRNGYSVVAKAYIDIGQIVVAEDAYIGYLSDHYGLMCNICNKEYVNLVPCKKCATAMFCPGCYGHFLHEYECGVNLFGESKFSSSVLYLIRSILLTIHAFPNIDELMTLIEHIRAHPNELPKHLLDDRSKYQVYNSTRLESRFETINITAMAHKIYPTYKLLWSIPHVREMFEVEKHRRFLMHLIGNQMVIPDFKIQYIAHFPESVVPDHVVPSVRHNVLMQRYFKHSCNPNVASFTHNGENILFTLKPIKKGEQLYIAHAAFEMNTQERQKILWDKWQIECTCPRCKGRSPSQAQLQQLITDPAYQNFEANKKYATLEHIDVDKLESLMENCATILRNFGHLQWCKEIDDVMEAFQSLFIIHTIGRKDFNHPLTHAFVSKFKM